MTQTKLVTFHHHQVHTYHNGWDISQGGFLPWMSIGTQAFPRLQLISDLLLKMLEKWLIYDTTPVPNSPCYTLSTRVRSDQKWSIAAIYGHELPSLHLPILIDFRSVHTALWVMNSFSPYNPFPTNLSLLYHYFHGMYSDEPHSHHSWPLLVGPSLLWMQMWIIPILFVFY